MTCLSISARRHLRALCIPQIQIPQLDRSIATKPQFRVLPSYPAPPPARRRLEPAPAPLHIPSPPERDDTPSQLTRRPTNRQIPFSHVYLLDPSTNKLSPRKHALEELLASHAGSSQPQGQRGVVELVTATPRPIVRITTRAEIDARYREMRRAVKKGARGGEAPKEVQLTWGVAPADVAHKLRKARRDLEKGCRVVVAVAVKNGHRPSSRNELVAFGDEISKTLTGAGEECKEREITNRLMVLTFRKVEVNDVP